MKTLGLFAILALSAAPISAYAGTHAHGKADSRELPTVAQNAPDGDAATGDDSSEPTLETLPAEEDPANDGAADDNTDATDNPDAITPDSADSSDGAQDDGAAVDVPSALPQAAQSQPPAARRGSERSLGSLDVDEVNHATFARDAEAIHGASPLILKVQVLLDRAGASPGVIDAQYGANVAKAIAAVETVLNLPVDGVLDTKVWAALGGDEAPAVLVPYKITAEDVAGPFIGTVPEDYAEQAKLKRLAYANPAEMFAERFHMDVNLLQALNPKVDFGQPGTQIIVAAVEGQKIQGKVARIEVDKTRKQVRAYDDQDRLVVAYPATIGSVDNPSPSGVHKVKVIAPNPVYNYDPKNFIQGNNMNKLTLPPGPNNPVGDMWIGLSEPGYGIHGTPEPSRIDKTGSHGCVRLTNWDAEELSTLVKPGVTVEFTE